MSENVPQPQLNLEDVRQFYNLLPRIYEPADLWHNATKNWIRRFILDHRQRISLEANYRVLNAGSGGEDCGFPSEFVYHLDIAERRIAHLKRAFTGDLHAPPFADGFFDISVCVGSVLNYCDAATAIGALGRVTRGKGHLFLEFETSWSLELCFAHGFMQPAAVVTTFYDTRKVRLWAYLEEYIRSILRANNFEVLAQSRAHIASPLVYQLTKDTNRSAWFSRLDPLLRRIPLLRRFCSNVIFFCRKT